MVIDQLRSRPNEARIQEQLIGIYQMSLLIMIRRKLPDRISTHAKSTLTDPVYFNIPRSF